MDHKMVSSFYQQVTAATQKQWELETSGFVHPFLYSMRRKSHNISMILINEKGELVKQHQKTVLQDLQKHSVEDAFFDQHIFRQLQYLETKDAQTLLQKFSFPVANRYVETLIRYALYLDTTAKITEADLRRAVLSALLMPLRQSVGSCFATAPAILIQKEQQKQFLQDLYELLILGKIKRIHQGIEGQIPITLSIGYGELFLPIQKRKLPTLFKDLFRQFGLKEGLSVQGGSLFEMINRALITKHRRQPNEIYKREKKELCHQMQSFTDHPLLRMWEYTIASLSDYQGDFHKWNFTQSLGLDPAIPGGIGEKLYEYLQEKLDKQQGEVEKQTEELQQTANEMKVTEALFRNATSSSQARRLKAQHQAKLYHFYSLKDQRDETYNAGKHYAEFLQFLLDQYLKRIPEYFQEIYDAEVFDTSQGLYEDRPAGFRLVCKWGRSDPSSWTYIYNASEYQTALAAFFQGIEEEIRSECEWEKGKKEISSMTTLLLSYIRSKDFVSHAIARIQKKHQEFRHRGGFVPAVSTPWSYISGGTMHHLLQGYYEFVLEIKEEKKEVETPLDLLIFFSETLKAMPYRILEKFETDPTRRLLAFSPTHAFCLLPGLKEFRKCWDNRYFTYTWIRDKIMHPAARFYGGIHILPEQLQVLFPKKEFSGVSSIAELRTVLLQQKSKQEVDLILYQTFPMIPREVIVDIDPKIQRKQVYFPYEEAITMLINRGWRLQFLEEHLQKFDLLRQKPVLFADTNWNDLFFAFAINPGTLEMQLCLTNFLGTTLSPLYAWDPYFQVGKGYYWGVLPDSNEYKREIISPLDPKLIKA